MLPGNRAMVRSTAFAAREVERTTAARRGRRPGCTEGSRMGRTVLRGRSTRGAAGVLVLVGLLLSCTDQRTIPVGQPAAALAAARTPAPSANDGFGETLDLSGLQDRFAAVAQRVSPTVVAISATEADFNYEAALRADDLNPDRLASILAGSDRTVGTGFIVDADG